MNYQQSNKMKKIIITENIVDIDIDQEVEIYMIYRENIVEIIIEEKVNIENFIYIINKEIIIYTFTF